MKIHHVCVVLLGVLTYGCGSNAVSTSVSGTIGGATIMAADTVGIVARGQSTTAAANAIITNFSGACQAFKSKQDLPANGTALVLSVVVNGTAVSPGTYQIAGGTPGASVGFLTADKTGQQEGTSGSVTLDTVSATTINGSFEVTMADGDHLSGTFVAPICN